jgi:hypothetical protein
MTDLCVYCGVLADSIDHVVPRHLLGRAEAAGLDLSRLMRMKDWTVSACCECNSILGGRIFRSMAERRKAAQDGLRKKYRSALSTPDWSEDELDTLGYRMRQKVVSAIALRDNVRQRIAWRGGNHSIDISEVFALFRQVAA